MRQRRIAATGATLDGVGVLVCLVVPLYAVDDGSGTTDRATLLAVNGPGALVPLGLFLALGLLAWLPRVRMVRVVAALAHAALTVLALATVGIFFVPATILLGIAALRDLSR